MSSGLPSPATATPALPEAVDVLIAGAGPTGLAVGVALASKGVECLVLEAASVAGRESSRATTLHAGTLELLDEVTLGHDLAAVGARAERSRVLRGSRVLVDQDWTRLPSAHAFMLNLPQAEVEALVRARLQSLGGDVRFGWTVGPHREERHGVTVEVAHNGEIRSVRCRFLIGCDGAHSAVRRGLGLSLEGETYAGTFVLADAELDGDLDVRSSWLGTSHQGLLGLLPLPAARWRINATLDEETPVERIDFDRLLRDRLPTVRVRIRHLAWGSTYTIHRRSTGVMRRGRVLLAGDAAHLNSPIGGQGMNRGIRDAFDLAWRLGHALRCERDRGERLLVEWEQERLGDARRVLAGTDWADPNAPGAWSAKPGRGRCAARHLAPSVRPRPGLSTDGGVGERPADCVSLPCCHDSVSADHPISVGHARGNRITAIRSDHHGPGIRARDRGRLPAARGLRPGARIS